MNLVRKIIASHLVRGNMEPGGEIAMRMDHTITQDALGMLAYLSFEQMGKDQVETALSVSYLDHNMLYTDYKNPDDHAYLCSVAKRYGITVSRAGNGICHSVHLARFAVPGAAAIGTDSHTPSCGAIGMLGFGAGGLDVGAVMAGEPVTITMPKVIRVTLTGTLSPGVNAKDAALELMRRVGVKGGRGCAFEFAGSALAQLSVPQRLTLANMSVETGATTAVFPADHQTKIYLAAQGRAKDFIPMAADQNATYDGEIEINLSMLLPMAAAPHQPDHVIHVQDAKHVKVDQVFIGSCTNSSVSDLLRAAAVLEGRRAAPHVSLIVSPGTRQNYLHLLEAGAISTFLSAGARILECGCGPCVGMGQAVRTGGVSVRTSNRNFKGRCGTADSSVYLASPETAAATAVLGRIAAVDEVLGSAALEALARIGEPVRYYTDDVLIDENRGAKPEVPVMKGPNIRDIPLGEGFVPQLRLGVVIKLGDNVSTDEIAPSGAKNVANRANIEEVSKSAFERIDPSFYRRALDMGRSVIAAGENYGQGSSREHAALMPMYLGVKAVIAKSFARIHKANLINFGILPLEFDRPEDYDHIRADDVLEIPDVSGALETGSTRVINVSSGTQFMAQLHISAHEREILSAGGVLRYIQQRKEGPT